MSETHRLQPGETTQLDPQMLIERAAVTDVVVAAGLLFDSGEFETLGTLYTADALFEMIPAPEGFPATVSTREQITDGLARLWQHNRETVGVHSRHATSNLLVTRLDADTAEVYSIFTVTGLYTDGRLGLRRLGNYVDLLHREGTAWRIAHRRLYMQGPPPVWPAAGRGTDQPGSDQPGSDRPGTEQPGTEQLAAEQRVSEQVEEPGA
ncbi:nuclear transport factor 2 family protein (plasmid) [Streptomyces sp. 4503]|uniref:Nuclear transport factor 2 family protein n=1 Tax=Streptomyces niphimycinicus TaxID=2842201 RepID=A0ABS6C6S7_9ACTN|nr:nuclear transport factor 2 family protein [Streptomyces niphimycinicus]MBU3862598.1 nuclear transport factor 2 family protein [Streptomyces niphimycinicus]